MDVYNSSDLKRNSNLIKSKLKTVGNTIITNTDLSILVYHKFVDKEMTILDNICKVMGIMAIIDNDNNYAIMTVPGIMSVEPNEIEDVEIDGEHYYKLVISKGDALISDTTIVKDTGNVYKVFDLLILKGKVPFFLNYEDMLAIFKNLPEFTGTKIGKDTLPFEIFIAMIARDKNDPTKDFRLTVKTHNDAIKESPKWVGLTNIYYSFGSTLSKIAGSYFKTGVLVAAVNKNKKPTKLEKILKG